MYPLETRELAVEAVAAGFSLTEAAELAGCSGGADKKLDTPVSGLESACTRWRPGSSPWRPSRRGSA